MFEKFASFRQQPTRLFLISEPTVTPIQLARDSSGCMQFGQEPYDLPKNGHIPSHYDLLPARKSPSSDNMELDSEWSQQLQKLSLL